MKIHTYTHKAPYSVPLRVVRSLLVNLYRMIGQFGG